MRTQIQWLFDAVKNQILSSFRYKLRDLTKAKLLAFFLSKKKEAIASILLPRIGLEPTYLAAPEPKSGVSTNSTIWAKQQNLVVLNSFVKD